MPDYYLTLKAAFAAKPSEIVGKSGDSVRLLGLVTSAMPSQVYRYDLVASAEVISA